MTAEIGLVLGILGVAFVLFATERLRVDIVALLALLALILTDLVALDEAFSGFSNPAVVTVWAIYIVSEGLTRTGVADAIAQYILRVGGRGEAGLIALLMGVVGVMSAFTNNIGATAVLLPAAISIGRKSGVSPSKLLIPLALGSLLGGTTTLVGTPPNLLASAALEQAGLEPFALTDYTPMGLIVMVSGILYMVFIGRRLLPSIEPEVSGPQLVAAFGLDESLYGVRVLPDSPLIGRTLVQTELGRTHDIRIVGIERDSQVRLGIMPNAHIQAGDVLFAHAAPHYLAARADELGLHFDPEVRLGDEELMTQEATLAEVVVSQSAKFIGKTMAGVDFGRRFGVIVLGIRREDGPHITNLARTPLRLGDTLLVIGRMGRVEALRRKNSFLVLGMPRVDQRRLERGPVALAIFLGMIALVISGVLHIAEAALLGAVLSVLTGCLTMEEAYRAIQWKSIFLIAGMLPMAIAMENTGTAQFLANLIIDLFGGLGPRGVLLSIIGLATLLTPFMSNSAATVLVAPIAITTALSLGLDPHPFAMATAMAASSAFMFPLGHQACILVYGPGGYKFLDFTRVGVPLTILIWVLLILFLPLLWPLQ